MTSPSDELSRFLGREQQRVDQALRRSLPVHDPEEPWLVEAMDYSLSAGGKRVRPILALHGCEVLGGSERDVLPAACALEWIHAFSLIHDDLPALDDDDMRRGKPSNHVRFGEALAILAGDALAVGAFQLVAERTPDPALAGVLVRELAAGAMGMIFGQTADVQWEGKEATPAALRSIHRQKTAALFRAALRIGAFAARAEPDLVDRFTTYGESIGLAFQVADDLLDVRSTDAELGKRAGKDAARGKNTYPSVFGIDESVRQAHELGDRAIAAIEGIPGSERLRDLARYIVERTH